MPSTVKSWPPWPQFIEAEGEKRPRNAQYKQEIVREYGADSIRRSWIQTCQTLGNLASEINRNGRTMIPTLSLEDFLDATDEKNEELKEVGCFVIRGVIPKPDATAWVHSLKEYVADNKEVITGTCCNPQCLPWKVEASTTLTCNFEENFCWKKVRILNLRRLASRNTGHSRYLPLSIPAGSTIPPQHTKSHSSTQCIVA